MPSPSPDIAVLGNVVLDVMVRPLSRWPDPGHGVHLDQIRLILGGCGSHTANTAAKLGAPTRLFGAVGKDAQAEVIRAELGRTEALDIDGLATVASEVTSTTVVLVSPFGERSFLCAGGASAAMDAACLPHGFPGNAAIFHHAGYYLLPRLMGPEAAKLFEMARRAGAKTSLDTAWKGGVDMRAALEPSLPLLDIVMPNVDEACQISGERTPEGAAGWFVSKGVGLALITNGEHGVTWADASGRAGSEPACRVKVLDTTGAGDAFAGGFLAATLLASSDPAWEPLERRIRFACAAGALACTELGGDAGLRDRDQVLALMAQA